MSAPPKTSEDSTPKPGIIIPLDTEKKLPTARLRTLKDPKNPAPSPAQVTMGPQAARPIQHPESAPTSKTGDPLKIVERDIDDAARHVEEAEKEANPYGGEFQLPPLKLLDYDAPNVAPVDENRMLLQAKKLVDKLPFLPTRW